jgi:hypothetical protein
MAKLTDTLKAALEKKHAAAHPDAKLDGQDSKTKPKRSAPVITGKPVKKVTGRGR